MQAQFLTPGTIIVNTPTSWYLPSGTIESVTFAYHGDFSGEDVYSVRLENDPSEYMCRSNLEVAIVPGTAKLMPLVDNSQMTMIEFMICSLINDEQDFDSFLFNSPYDIPAHMGLPDGDDFQTIIRQQWVRFMVQAYTDKLMSR